MALYRRNYQVIQPRPIVAGTLVSSGNSTSTVMQMKITAMRKKIASIIL